MNQSVIGDILVKEGLLSPADLERALQIQARDGGSLTRIAANLKLADEEIAARAVAKGLGLDFNPLSENEAPANSPDIFLPPKFCRQRRVLPLGVQGRSLRLAMADPLDHATIQDVEFQTSKWVVGVVATETAILKVLDRLNPEAAQAGALQELLEGVGQEGEVETTVDAEPEGVDTTRLAREVEQPPIVRLVNGALTEAARTGASDVHFEPQEACLQVRHRVDGMLQDVLRIPRNLQEPVVSRLKIISGMDIAERRKPQDGRSRLRVEDRSIDLRVSTLPTTFGEKVVVRLLDGRNALTEIGRIGFAPSVQKSFQDLLTRPQGMVLVTGPTGSGKTSTLYAALNWVRTRAKNIITVEDPIEYQLDGISQVQINTRAGVTFAAGLRSILRQDPNIVLVGEIRDRETAGIALEAAQTGHLLLSTLHTNDAPSSITRLIDLGTEPFLVASSVIGILAQRLVRRVCAACAAQRDPAPDRLERVRSGLPAGAKAEWRNGAGCAECRQSGYRGRLGIHELLVVTDEVRGLIAGKAPDHQIREAARRGGMRLLWEDGVAKAAQGLTTLDEILRVAPPAADAAPPQGGTRPTDRGAAAGKASPAPARPGAARDGAGKARVLVVEDSQTEVMVVKYFLELEGFEVIAAEDGLAGLEAARRQVPDVVVSDLNMPGMDGISLVKALREDPRTRGVAILMLTSESSVESEARGLEIGADDYLAKPVEPRRLAARVRAVLARAGTRRAGAA
jgi:type IV pilus assembly protein PilB